MRLAERIGPLSSYASSFGRTISFALMLLWVTMVVGYCGHELYWSCRVRITTGV